MDRDQCTDTKMVAGESFTSAKGISETPLFEHHLYTLEKPITLRNNQAKQISLLSVDCACAKGTYL